MLKVKGDKGHTIHKKNIRADYIKDIQSNIRFYIAQLGMTPRARGSKATNGGDEIGNGFEEFI